MSTIEMMDDVLVRLSGLIPDGCWFVISRFMMAGSNDKPVWEISFQMPRRSVDYRRILAGTVICSVGGYDYSNSDVSIEQLIVDAVRCACITRTGKLPPNE